MTKIRESIHYVFLYRAIFESGMDVGIVNSNEMLVLDELEDEMNTICENLAFNKTEEAIDELLARTIMNVPSLRQRRKIFLHLVNQDVNMLIDLERSLLMIY